ncbi:hypothetical protein [Alsobacter metallidurans]|uniref:hypothetical protein n=1 Tax=Alsobacter metallidurans TaxID=340221 RepID=UPI00166C44BC|nr:hypothetical protein [Alsobacter metallidurans]
MGGDLDEDRCAEQAENANNHCTPPVPLHGKQGFTHFINNEYDRSVPVRLRAITSSVAASGGN